MTSTRDDDEIVGKRNTGSRGPWNPFQSFRKTISPEERLALLQMKRPIVPPEELMDTGELRRLKLERRRARLRQWMPALVGLGALLFALLLAVVWRSLSSPPTASQSAQAEATRQTPDVLPSTPSVAHSPPSSQPAAPTSQPTAQVSAARASLAPSPPSAASSTKARPKAPSPASIASSTPSRPAAVRERSSGDLDLDTPLAPPIH